MRWAIGLGVAFAVLIVVASMDLLPFREWFHMTGALPDNSREKFVVPVGGTVPELIDFIVLCEKDRSEPTLLKVCEACDKIFAHGIITPEERVDATHRKFKALAYLCEKNSEKYSPEFDKFYTTTIESYPGTEYAAIADMYRIIKEHGSQDEVMVSGSDALIEHAKKYPTSQIGYERNLKLVKNLLAVNNESVLIPHVAGIVTPYGADPEHNWLVTLHNNISLVGNEPKIAGPGLDGARLDVAKHKGKVVLVDFWGTWCSYCVVFLPSMKTLYDQNHDKGFEILGVAVDQSADEVKQFVKERKIPWPHIFFTDPQYAFTKNPLSKYYAIGKYPYMILVGRDGKAVLKLDGITAETEKILRDAVAKELAKPAPAVAK